MTDEHDLTDPHGEAEALRRENEALAAWACLFMDGTGLTHDAWGNTVCRKSIEAEALRRENARLREELMAGRASRWVGAYRQLDAAIARAEAAEAEVARLRAEIAEATDPDFIWGALDNVHDCDTTLDDYAAAVSRAQREALSDLAKMKGE